MYNQKHEIVKVLTFQCSLSTFA